MYTLEGGYIIENELRPPSAGPAIHISYNFWKRGASCRNPPSQEI